MESVKQWRTEQRAALDGEPRCVVCGRFGEYICDVADADVCSRECKELNLQTAAAAPAPAATAAVTAAVAASTTGLYCYPDHTSTADADAACRARHGIEVQGRDVPAPAETFAALQLPRPVAANLAALGYVAPTPIQMQCLPVVLQRRDLLAGAATGTGKTLAYVLGIVCRLWTPNAPPRTDGPMALVLCPTRELAAQIEGVCKALMRGLPHMRTALVVGGEPVPPQLHRLRSGVHVVMATPGRLSALCRTDADVTALLGAVDLVVLDEVDEMLQHGFEQQVRELLSRVRATRQTVAFSATIPPATELAALALLHDPVLVAVGDVGATATNVFQTVLWVDEMDKKHKIVALLTDPRYYRPPVLIFVETKIGTELLAHLIHRKCELDARAIHGDMAQPDRVAALAAFIAGTAPVLVATGLLARGLDLANVATVILFDMASSVEDYVHQIGRAARGAKTGWAITFINMEARPLFPNFLRLLHQAVPGRLSPLPPQLVHAVRQMQAVLDSDDAPGGDRSKPG